MAKSFRPSNQTEASIFINRFCVECSNFKMNEDIGMEDCDILSATQDLSIDHPDYPKQFIYKDDGPTCTAFNNPQELPMTEADKKYLKWKESQKNETT